MRYILLNDNGENTMMLIVLYHFTAKFTHRYNADIYLKLSDNPDLSEEISG